MTACNSEVNDKTSIIDNSNVDNSSENISEFHNDNGNLEIKEDEPIDNINGNPQNVDVKDFFKYKGMICSNASESESLKWVLEKDIDIGEFLGSIKTTGVTKDIEDFEASNLPVGTEIYKTNEPDILVARTEDGDIRYFCWREG